jgi:hypothetical protein
MFIQLVTLVCFWMCLGHLQAGPHKNHTKEDTIKFVSFLFGFCRYLLYLPLQVFVDFYLFSFVWFLYIFTVSSFVRICRYLLYLPLQIFVYFYCILLCMVFVDFYLFSFVWFLYIFTVSSFVRICRYLLYLPLYSFASAGLRMA